MGKQALIPFLLPSMEHGSVERIVLGGYVNEMESYMSITCLPAQWKCCDV
jgi:hypothetical protein